MASRPARRRASATVDRNQPARPYVQNATPRAHATIGGSRKRQARQKLRHVVNTHKGSISNTGRSMH
jgi:hypothetical protein